MKLPPLPKKRNRKEANIQHDVLQWLLKNTSYEGIVEIKIKGNKLLLHQKKSLEQANSGGLAYKVPDVMMVRKPADGFIARKGLEVVCEGRSCIAYKDNNKEFEFKV